jgi:hypothetical protein
MSWREDRDALTQKARLFLASPEVVFQELKKLDQGSERRWWDRNDTFEPTLVERNDPLINLGLACFGANKDVLSALYKHSLLPATSTADAVYKEGLRIGCLSNTAVEKAHIILKFPADIIGADETRRILSEGKDGEVVALIRNPSVSDKLLESLYKRTDVFAQMPEERWRQLVALSARNERLVTEYEYHDSPDLEFMHIQDAIFALLEIAPLNMWWLRTLYDLLDHLDFQRTETPDKIDHVLARWATLDDKDSDGKPCEWSFTGLPLKEEFRCLIAAMYGRGFVKSKFVEHGDPAASDIALRCAFYGKGELTASQMKAAYKKDKEVYAFAALYNTRVYHQGSLRKLFEEEHLPSDLAGKYRKHDALVQKRWPREIYELEPPADGAERDNMGSRIASIETATLEVSRRVAEVASQLKETKHLVIIAGVVLAFLLWYRH